MRSLGVVVSAMGCGAQVASVEPAAVESGAVREVEAVPASTDNPPIVFGDIYGIYPEDNNADVPPTLFVAMELEPMPESAPIGTVAVHAGEWTIRVLREVPIPYATASVVDTAAEVCEARVTGARVLHAHLAPAYGNEGAWTFLGLELAGCTQGNMAVAGASARAHHCERSQMHVPAPRELARLVQAVDEDLGWEDPIPLEEFRMLEFPRHHVTIVVGSGAWVVRDGVLLNERYNGVPRIVVEAGDELFFQMTAPSEDWAASLAHFAPAPTR